MLTIFEGPDGAGKTTLINELARRWLRGVRTHHGDYPDVADVASMYVPDLITATLRDVLMDRCWISERPYADAFRGGITRISPGAQRMLERLAWSARTVVVICLPPFDRCRNAFLARKGEEYLDTVDQLKEVYDGYQLLSTHLPTVRYDFTTSSPDELEDQLMQLRPRFNQGPGIGHFEPGVTLLVGERPHPPATRNYPFVSFDAGCSGWLADQLEKTGVPERDLYWVNAFDHHDRETTSAFLHHLQPHRIVALGRVAGRWCEATGRPHAAVPHPQHWKRFHHHDEYPLIPLLKET